MAIDGEVLFDGEDAEEFLKQLKEKFGSIKSGTKALGGLISNIVFADIIDHFEKETGPDGKWSPWSQVYADHMNRIGRGGNKMLQFSGRLRQGVMPNNYRGISEGVIFYNNVNTANGFPYAQAHDQGRGRLPKRSFMWVGERAMENISSQVMEWITDGN